MTAMKRNRSVLSYLPVCLAVLILILLASSDLVYAQAVSDDAAPPPLKLLSKDELVRLGLASDVKKRTQAALELMAVRLTKAEAAIAQENLDQMYKELGGFHGLMENMLLFLNAGDKGSGKVLNNFKRFEMGLRQFRPRLELIRRDMPVRYEPYVRDLILYVREARAKAVEPLFSNSVVPTTKP